VVHEQSSDASGVGPVLSNRETWIAVVGHSFATGHEEQIQAVLSIIRSCRRATVRYLLITRIGETGDQASGNDRPLLAQLSRSAIDRFRAHTARP
jgi:hypothetical protein